MPSSSWASSVRRWRRFACAAAAMEEVKNTREVVAKAGGGPRRCSRPRRPCAGEAAARAGSGGAQGRTERG